MVALVLLSSCSTTSGPVRPEPGVGRPVDPASAAPPPAARTDSAVKVVPPLEPEPEPRRAERPVQLPSRLPSRRPGAPAASRPQASGGGRIVRILLGVERDVAFTADVPWEAVRRGEPVAVAVGAPERTWRIARDGAQLRMIRADGAATPFRRGVIEVRPTGAPGLMGYGGRTYRGALAFHATDDGIMVVNAVPLEDYLGGVVPREIGESRTMGEIAAVEAQAVAARSYAMTHLRGASAPYDMRATTADQVYGGAGAETAVGNRAVSSTRGLVLRYGSRIVNAPYHSTCGGSTAEAQEVWSTRGEPYLQRVSDRIPGTARDYCEPSARYRWTKSIDAAALDAAVARHLREVASTVPRSGPGPVREVRVATRAPSGRAGSVVFATASGAYTVRGNDARSVLRQPGGEILSSAYFSVVGPVDARGGVRLEGRGYGHGVGMCQWGAIGRARAGQGFRTILQTYFPGTTVSPAS